MKKKNNFLLLVIIGVLLLMKVNVFASNTYFINGVAIHYDDVTSSPNECWEYANQIYCKIWGQRFTNVFNDNNNALRNLSDSEITLTPQHLKTYVSNAALGSVLRICNSDYLHGTDGWGHSQIIVQKDSNGFTVFQGGLSASPYRNERYYTWNEYCSTGWLGGTYAYIKYIKWPGAPAYQSSNNGADSFISLLATPEENGNYTNIVAIEGYALHKNGIAHVTAWVNGQWIDCPMYNSPNVAKAYPGYPTGNEGFYREIPVQYLKEGINEIDVCAYEADDTLHRIATRKFNYTTGKKISIDTQSVISVSDNSASVTAWVNNPHAITVDTYGVQYYEENYYSSLINIECGVPWNQIITRIELKNTISGLKPNTKYNYRFFARENGNIYYGEFSSFSTKKSKCNVDGHTGGNATCIAKAICSVCGENYGNLDVNNHVGEIEVRNRKEATCAQSGYTGDAYCKDCHTMLSSGKAIEKKNHTWNAGQVTKQPTTTEIGIKTYTCRNCGTTRTEIIAKLEQEILTPGKTIKDKTTNGVYKVLKDGLSVEYTKPLSKKASIRIPDEINTNGIICKVTGISAKAFKNNSSLKTVTIGKNVTRIGSNAFYGCKKLRTITIKTSMLTSNTIGAKAFAGIYSKAEVRVPVKQLEVYKKLLKSKGMRSKAVYGI